MLSEEQELGMRLQAWAEATGCVVKGRTLASVPEDAGTLTIPEGIEIIGDHAFVPGYKRHSSRNKADWPPTALKEVGLPRSLKKIEACAFRYCVNLRELEIPSNVTEIEDVAFADCTGLERVRLPDGLLELGSCVFSDCTSLRSLEIPWGIKEILWDLCRNCVNLEEVILRNGLEEISQSAFQNCKKLRRADLPVTLKTIGMNAFQGCTSLETVTYHGNLESIGPYAFEDCDSLTEIRGPRTRNFGKAFRNTPYGLAHLPRTGPCLPRAVTGVHMGHWLIAQGYDFFDADREYTIGPPDENGVVEVSSWSGTEGPDEDGFGMEEEYDWWLLDENLQPIPGIACWHDYSNVDMRGNEEKWAKLQKEAGKLLRQRYAREEQKAKWKKCLHWTGF